LKILDCQFLKIEYQNLLSQHHIERIIEVLKEEFNLILLDLNRDIELVGHDYCFKKATCIYNVLDYDFSHCMDFQKMRILYAKVDFIKKKPKKLIINMAIDNPKFNPELLESFYKPVNGENVLNDDNLESTPLATVPMMYEANINAIYEGYSLIELDSPITEDFRNEISKIAYDIHPYLSQDANKKSFLSSFIDKLTKNRKKAQSLLRDSDHA